MVKYRQIEHCRVARNSKNLIPVLNLGRQALTGVFPKTEHESVTVGPLELVWCQDSGLLQLNHTYEPEELYGDNYGYRSGLNQSMVDHLTQKVRYLTRLVDLQPGDAVLDIGSNDCTTLNAYGVAGLKRIGFDPTGEKFSEFYPPDVGLVPDFFSSEGYNARRIDRAKIVTSIAMLYDLDDPVSFARQVEEVLSDDGVWHFEQSYMPSMLRMNSYDTICHEHLEYYSLDVVRTILEASGFKMIDVVMNSINGGSFAVTAAKAGNMKLAPNDAIINWLLDQESRMGLDTPKPFRDFEERVFRHRADFVRLIRSLAADGKKVLGYGASTKGNVVLQFCGLTSDDICAIAEVNEDKFGCVTPGSGIPIISEEEARAMEPDYFLVLPWHFKENILRREGRYMADGGKFIFPFPEIEII